MKNYDNIVNFGLYSLLKGTDRQGNADTWFVDGNSGNAANNANTGQGASWDLPLSTLNYAISRCSNDASNVIFVAADHTENWSTKETASGTTTTGACVNKSGVTIIGWGSQDRRPTFSTTAAAGTLNVIASECSLYNLVFKSNFADTATLIITDSGGDGLLVENCEFRDNSAITEHKLAISIAANCNDTVIRGCRFLVTDTASATEAAIRYVGAHYRSTVQDCLFRGDWGGGSSDAVIDASATASFDFFCDGNIINNIDPTFGACIIVHASTTGVVSNNVCYSTGVGSVPIVAAGCIKAGNKETLLTSADAVDWQRSLSATKTYVNWTAGAHTLFNIVGGPVRINYIVGVVMDTIKATASNLSLNAATTDPGGALALGTALEINADAIGTLYTINGTFGAALVATTVGAVADTTEGFFMNIGAVSFSAVAEEDGGGSIQWSIGYTPLHPNARIVPATTD